MRKKKRKMTKFSLSEVSFVDRPAQTSALAEIAKSEGTAGRPSKNDLLNSLLAAHDAAPNAEKRGCMILVEKTVGEMDLEAVVGQVLTYAEERFNHMVADVGAVTGSLDAKAAVRETAHGQALEEVIELAEQMLDALPSMAKAEVNFERQVRKSHASTEIDNRLAKQRAEERLIKRAKAIQIEKAKTGRPLAFLDAYEIAKSGS